MVLKRGSRGPQVERVQRILGAVADGIYGRKTERLVLRFQAQNDLTVDGKVWVSDQGETWPLLLEMEAASAEALAYRFVSPIRTGEPVYCSQGPHNGGGAIDLVGPEPGTLVYAAAGGTVYRVNHWSPGDDPRVNPNGNGVWIQHADGSTTAYIHLDSISPGVDVGAAVDVDTVIGVEGHTGYCEPAGAAGRHLHWEVYPPADLRRVTRFSAGLFGVGAWS